jgi:hypothetical protein
MGLNSPDSPATPKVAFLVREDGSRMGPYEILNVEPDGEPEMKSITLTLGRRPRPDLDEAMRLYQDGASFKHITAETGATTTQIMATKTHRGIPDRPQRTDGTMRRWP